MNWKKWTVRILSYILVAVLASAVTLFAWAGKATGVDKLTQLQSVIDQYFVGEADMAVAQDMAAAAMVYALGDEWSYYVPASEVSGYQETKDNSYVGIGVTIAVREDGIGIDIKGVALGGAAEAAGVLPGDILIKVDGQSIAGKTIDQVRALVTGEENTEVTLVFLRELTEKTITLKRQKTVVATGRMLEGNVGYVRINNFNAGCADETLAAIKQLQEQGATKLIFDVRNNPGGYADEMIKVLDYLLPKGVLFCQEDYRGNRHETTSDEACLELPMAVLVNGDSYSAAEFFAAALQEYEWAGVVGEKTSGKGYYQIPITLSDGSVVNLSVGKYFTPKGVNLTEVDGLSPDVTVAVDKEIAEKIAVNGISLTDDPQIQAAIATLQGK